jgi:hypothetical protein
MGQYQHRTYRSIAMFRGALISMLYNKATDLSLTSVDPASSLTLMSADIERIVMGMQTMHELWSNTIEVALAIYLLERQLGAACAIPIGVAVGKWYYVLSVSAPSNRFRRQFPCLARSVRPASLSRAKPCGSRQLSAASPPQLPCLVP